MGRDQWRALGARIDAMSLRERAFVFAAAVVVVWALVQTLLIDAGRQRVLNADTRLQSARSALEQIEQQRQLLAGQAGHNPDQSARAALGALEAKLAGLNTDLETRGHTLVPPERMAQVLKDVVRGQPGVRIDSIKTLSPHPILLAGAPEGSPPAFYRHGFEITVIGSYAGLVAYLERLEALPWHLNWAEATLDASGRPDLKLTLVVHTLSLEEAWLRV